MTEQEDFIVGTPYQPTEIETQAIKKLSEGGLSSGDWNSTKEGIISFKDNMRDDMYLKQNRLCAYCRIEIPIAVSYLHREHIVPKSRHPQWMFEPRNLCCSCEICNNNKLDKEVLHNPDIQQFPTESADFKIINPFLDRYSDHIELMNDIIYKGKTEKGRFTIDTCKLSRVELAIERAKIKINKDNQASIKSDILALAASTKDEKQVSLVQERVTALINRYMNTHQES